MLIEGPTPAESAVLDQHLAYLEQLAVEGVVLLAGRTQTRDPGTFGIVILEAGSAGEAQRIMTRDPAVREGIMRAQLFPYRIAVISNRLGKS